MFLLDSGWVISVRLGDGGLRQIVGTFLPGDLIGIRSMLLECQSAVVKCLTEIQVRAIDQESVQSLLHKITP